MKTLQIFSDIDELTLFAVSNFADSLEDGEEGVIEIASHGGAVFYGNAAFQKIQMAQNRGCKFIAKIYGIAASSAADIALSCDRIEMADTSALKTHSAFGASKDRGIEIANMAQLSVIHKRLPEYTEKDLAEDRWFTAKEALSLGICDSIFGLQSDSTQARLCAKYLSTSHVGGFAMEDQEKKIEEVVEEKKEIEEVKDDAAPSVEEVLEKIAERLDDVEARLVALEAGIKAECGDAQDDDRRDNARMKAIWTKLSAISKPAASTESVIATAKVEDPKAALERYKSQFPNLDSYIKNLD